MDKFQEKILINTLTVILVLALNAIVYYGLYHMILNLIDYAKS